MPVLPLEPFVFPDDLLCDSPPPGSESARWWVLHTRPRAEKCLARQLLGRRLPFFLPLHAREGWNRGRLLRSYLPLFPGYVFLYGDCQARLDAFHTKLVARVLPAEDQNQLHRDLVQVHHLITAGLPLLPEDRLEAGDLVDIVCGPLAGLEGRVIRRGKQRRLLIEVQFLQRGVSVEIEGWMIQAKSEDRPSSLAVGSGR